MRTILLVLFCVITLATVSCRTANRVDNAMSRDLQAALKNPDSVTLFTLANDYDVMSETITEEEYREILRGSALGALGQAEVDVSSDGKALIETLQVAAATGENYGAMCFMPHHAIRVRKGGARWDIVVCFMCCNYRTTQKGFGFGGLETKASGMETTWRNIVRKHGLRDISDKY